MESMPSQMNGVKEMRLAEYKGCVVSMPEIPPVLSHSKIRAPSPSSSRSPVSGLSYRLLHKTTLHIFRTSRSFPNNSYNNVPHHHAPPRDRRHRQRPDFCPAAMWCTLNPRRWYSSNSDSCSSGQVICGLQAANATSCVPVADINCTCQYANQAIISPILRACLADRCDSGAQSSGMFA